MFCKPVMGGITSGYGPRSIGFHNGIDFGWLLRDVAGSRRVYSAHPGTVVDAGYSSAPGNYVLVDIGDGKKLRYIHLSRIDVSVGQEVGYSTPIGVMGDTGTSTAPGQVHLHLDLFDGSNRVDPEPYLTLPFGYTGPAFAEVDSTPIPATPAPTAHTDEEDDVMSIKVGARKEADGTAKEWMRAAPFIEGGYEVTTDETRARAWGRLHGKGHGPAGWDFFVPREDYIAIQKEALSAHRHWLTNK